MVVGLGQDISTSVLNWACLFQCSPQGLAQNKKPWQKTNAELINMISTQPVALKTEHHRRTAGLCSPTKHNSQGGCQGVCDNFSLKKRQKTESMFLGFSKCQKRQLKSTNLQPKLSRFRTILQRPAVHGHCAAHWPEMLIPLTDSMRRGDWTNLSVSFHNLHFKLVLQISFIGQILFSS